MAHEIRKFDPYGFDKGHSSKFCVGFRVQQTPKEGQRTYQSKHYRNKNKDEDNSPKTLNDKNHQASSQKFRQLIPSLICFGFLACQSHPLRKTVVILFNP